MQQLYYTELRQKVLRSQSRQQEALFFQLAASALQAEVGDLEQRDKEDKRKRRAYFLPEDYFPSWVQIKTQCNCIFIVTLTMSSLYVSSAHKAQRERLFAPERSSVAW